MPSRELPARPSLEYLKKQAKSLLDAAKTRQTFEALRRFAVLPSLAGKSPARSTPPIWRCTTRSRPSRASTGFCRGTPCGKVTSRAPCRSTRRSTSSSAAPPAARPAARNGCSRSIRGWRRRPADRARRPGRCRGCHRSPPKPPRARAAAGRSAGLGAGSFTSATPRRTRARRIRLEGLVKIARRFIPLGANPNARVPLELASQASTDGALGRRGAPWNICRWRRCCSTAAPTPPPTV